MAALEADRVTVRLGGGAVVRDVSLRLNAGEIAGLFGPSGAGKSTLLRALSGEQPIHAGAVRLAGEDVTRRPLWERARRGLGYLPQTPSVLWDLTVAENLAAFGAFRRAARGAAGALPRDPSEIASRLGLADRMGVRAAALSGGERRRLELARALCAAPRVLLCDEPFGGVDPQGTSRVGSVLRETALAGAAVLVSDHHVAQALPLCDRAVLLLAGEVVLDGPAGAFPSHDLVRKHYAVSG